MAVVPSPLRAGVGGAPFLTGLLGGRVPRPALALPRPGRRPPGLTGPRPPSDTGVAALGEAGQPVVGLAPQTATGAGLPVDACPRGLATGAVTGRPA